MKATLPDGVIEITFVSSGDGGSEPALFYHPGGTGPVPLVVGLHTWSYDRYNQLEGMLPLCRERGWALLLPEFRGPNLVTNRRARQTAGSALAVRDILDGVEAVAKRYPIDRGNLFLLGGSGGGMAALLAAAAAPELWKGVSSWVPITDLAAWHGENQEYAPHIEACCGGAPGASDEVDREYRERSAINMAEQLSRVNLSLHHGRFDPLVSWRHSRRLIGEMERVGAERFFFEIFDGEHDIRYPVAFGWFEGLRKNDNNQGGRLTG
ncbi:alpha/beta hydrolase family protein [Geomonas anaerohicana]|uniref:Prolyl oligopeptidase family serine peptidase n=1 Tax=Geomonas anaerohicana TaxID=2798583 RepID=A0ABS0YJ19_9BACT|nr:prolyl oligopeptidase family serine peptidase [Geomonas anaerohicana]MBJ6752337.1 prolyl oligopeptidase family serine peptidase [Geomonas anaerohicana]